MVGTKSNSSYRKTRKRKRFSGVHVSVVKKEKAQKDLEIVHSKPGTSQEKCDHDESNSSAEESVNTPSASRKKMRLYSSKDESFDSSEEEAETKIQGDGYRLVHLKTLSSALSSLHKCEDGEW